MPYLVQTMKRCKKRGGHVGWDLPQTHNLGKKNKMERKEEGWKNNLNTYFVDHLTYFFTF